MGLGDLLRGVTGLFRIPVVYICQNGDVETAQGGTKFPKLYAVCAKIGKPVTAFQPMDLARGWCESVGGGLNMPRDAVFRALKRGVRVSNYDPSTPEGERVRQALRENLGEGGKYLFPVKKEKLPVFREGLRVRGIKVL